MPHTLLWGYMVGNAPEGGKGNGHWVRARNCPVLMAYVTGNNGCEQGTAQY